MSISKLLIANRGEIASRVIRTARAMDITTVAVFSDPDAGLPYVAEADEAVRLPGSAPAGTYLRGDALIAAAAATGADAVHPGYGFLSENAGFARACAAAGLTFVGPSPRAIEAMGSKTAAKELMAAAGVPVLPSAVFDSAVSGDGAGPDPAELRKAGEDIGFPLLVKAAYGGGGRGMRIVAGPDEIADAVASASREAASAFGNGTVFLERFAESPRHIEVQILGDQAGTVVHLFERECSIQRRYQKIIEEAPSPAVNGELRARLCQAAVAAGQAIGYVGAGTVEFVLDSSGRFYFLEVNTRLQVEHPVTELITGLDLVRLQLEIASGQPLPRRVAEMGLSQMGPGGMGPGGWGPGGWGWPARRPRGRVSPATRSRPGSTPRTCPPGTCPRAVTCSRWRSARRTACAWTRASPPGPGSAPSTTRCWPRSSGTARPGTTRGGCWPRRCRGPGCTAW